jgi:hypothetical protein
MREGLKIVVERKITTKASVMRVKNVDLSGAL